MIRVENRKSIPIPELGQELDTCCKMKNSIPPINSCVHIFIFEVEKRGG